MGRVGSVTSRLYLGIILIPKENGKNAVRIIIMVVLFSKRCLSATAQHPLWSFPGMLAEELFCVTRRPSVRGRDCLARHSAPAGPPHVRVCDACAAVCGHRRTARACRERRHVHRRLPCGLRQRLQLRRPPHGLKPHAPPAPGSVGRPQLGAKVVPELEGGSVCDSGGWQGPGCWFLHLLRTRSGIPSLSQSAWNHPQERTGQRTRPLAGSWPGGGSPGTCQVAEPWGSRLPSRSFCGASAWIIWKI